MAANDGDCDEAVNRMLRRGGDYFQTNRAYVFLLDTENQTISCTHAWCREDLEPHRVTLPDISLNAIPWWWRQIQRRDPVLATDVDELPAEAAASDFLAPHVGIQSLRVFPLKIRHQVFGFVGFQAARRGCDWSDQEIDFCHILGDLMAIALSHSQIYRALRRWEQGYRALYETLADAVIVIDRVSGLIVDANRRAETLTGWSINLLRDLSITALHPTEWEDLVVEHLLADAATGPTTNLELPLLHFDGHAIPVGVQGGVPYPADSRLLAVCVYRDIGEHKHIKE